MKKVKFSGGTVEIKEPVCEGCGKPLKELGRFCNAGIIRVYTERCYECYIEREAEDE